MARYSGLDHIAVAAELGRQASVQLVKPVSSVNSGLERAAAIMRDFPGPWGVAGGWAIDLFLQRESRPHSDIDVALLHGDQQHLRSRIPAEGRQKVVERRVSAWRDGEVLEPPLHEVHATWPDGYRLEFLLNDHDRERRHWLFRRDHRVSRPLVETFMRLDGVPYLAPEIVLLYKSKAPRAEDDADLAATLPHLGAVRRRWLREALSMTAPGHRWVETVAREP